MDLPTPDERQVITHSRAFYKGSILSWLAKIRLMTRAGVAENLDVFRSDRNASRQALGVVYLALGDITDVSRIADLPEWRTSRWLGHRSYNS